VRLKEALGGSVSVVTLGPAEAEGALRAALALGADTALRLWNPRAADWGPFTIAAALAAVLQNQTPQYSLILCGDKSSDWSSGIVGPALAAHLALPQVTGVIRVTISSDTLLTLRLERGLERGYREVLEAKPPLLLTVSGSLNEPRYPSLTAHLAALRASIPVVDPQPLLGDASWLEEADDTRILETHTPRPRPHHLPAPDSQHSAYQRIGEIVTGGAIGRQTRLVEGTAEELAQALVEFLRARGFTAPRRSEEA
jgi:electron transfer flavoprotein beta subunit